MYVPSKMRARMVLLLMLSLQHHCNCSGSSEAYGACFAPRESQVETVILAT